MSLNNLSAGHLNHIVRRQRNIGAKGVLSALLQAFVLLLLTSPVRAEVDISFYENVYGCSGTGYSCYNIESNTCCYVDAVEGGTVLVSSSSGSGCLGSGYYRYGSCNTLVYSSSGNTCLTGGTGDFTGANWYNECSRRRSLLSGRANNHAPCTKRVKPTGVVFTEDASQGNWILHGASNVTELYAQLKTVPAGEKVAWFKSQGATYKAFTSDGKLESNVLGLKA